MTLRQKNVLGAVVSKEGYANSALEFDKLITVDLLQNDATLSNASYNQLLRQNSPYLLIDDGMLFVLVKIKFVEQQIYLTLLLNPFISIEKILSENFRIDAIFC